MNSERLPNFIRVAIPRGLALFLGGFALLNLAQNLLRSTLFDATLWWIDLRGMSPVIVQPLLLASALSFIAFALRPPTGGWRRHLTAGCAGVLAVLALANAIEFYLLLFRGRFHSACPIPLSLVVGTGLAVICAAVLHSSREMPKPESRSLPGVALVCLGCLVAFPLAQMVFFGKTDYRRPADVAIVLGARTYASGRPSDALADRVRTAARLYLAGEVKALIMSGGPGDGAVHETEAMKRMAIQMGVKPEDILADKQGRNTRDTVRNTEPMLRQMGASRVLVVSHFYHLPRVKLAYRQAGREVYTVPAQESRVLAKLPYNMAREVAALWVYYLSA